MGFIQKMKKVFSGNEESADKAPSKPMEISGPTNTLSNSDIQAMVEREKNGGGAMGQLRTASDIEERGVLDEFAALEGRRVSESEYDRTIADDAIIVQQGLGKLSAEEISALKEKAYNHPEAMADLDAAIEMGHYGSALHRQYGALIETLTGGVVSTEEAMAMNPTGGIPGPGAKQIPVGADLDVIARHAMRHDATGFLLTRFDVGPGYGSKTSFLGRSSDDPLAGQILGVLREIVKPSELPSAEAQTAWEKKQA